MPRAHKSVLPEEFFERDPETVARDLLGMRLIRRLDEDFLGGIIVEAEAYYGLNDPASRARAHIHIMSSCSFISI